MPRRIVNRSDGHWIEDTVTGRVVAGPYKTRSNAVDAHLAFGEQKSRAETEKARAQPRTGAGRKSKRQNRIIGSGEMTIEGMPPAPYAVNRNRRKQVWYLQRSHRADLQRCGLSTTEIDKLDAALPTCSLYVHPNAPLNDLRKAFGTIADSLGALLATLDVNTRATKQLMNRIQLAAFESGQHEFDLLALLVQLKTLENAAHVARKGLPTQETRYRASPLPIGLIHNALGSAFKVGRRAVQFKKIVSICYEALGHRIENPERAIRAYVAQRKFRTAGHNEPRFVGPKRPIKVATDQELQRRKNTKF